MTSRVIQRSRQQVQGRERVKNSRSRDKVAHPVNKSGFQSRRQNSWNWSSSRTRWTVDSQESSGQVVLRHGPRAQILWEGGNNTMLTLTVCRQAPYTIFSAGCSCNPGYTQRDCFPELSTAAHQFILVIVIHLHALVHSHTLWDLGVCCTEPRRSWCWDVLFGPYRAHNCQIM